MSTVEDRWELADDFPYEVTFPGSQVPPAVTVAAGRHIIQGLADPVLADYELRAETAMVQALQQVMDTIADRIGHIQTASLDVLLAHLPGKHDQSTHGHGGSVEDLHRGPARSVSDAAKGTNPHYGSTLEGPTYRAAAKNGEPYTPDMGPPPSGGYEENCTNCVMAFEMRARGYDVEAAPLSVLDKYGYASGRTDKEIDKLVTDSWQSPGGGPHGRTFSGQKWRSLKEVDKEIQSWPEGGRGFVFVGKHVFSAVNNRGKAQYVESQFDASPSRTVTGDYRKRFGGKSGQGKVVRLDDLEPTGGIFDSIVPIPGTAAARQSWAGCLHGLHPAHPGRCP